MMSHYTLATSESGIVSALLVRCGVQLSVLPLAPRRSAEFAGQAG